MRIIYEYATCRKGDLNQRGLRSLYLATFIKNHYLNCNEMNCPCKNTKFNIINIERARIPIQKSLSHIPMAVVYKKLIFELINRNFANYIAKNKKGKYIGLHILHCLFIFHEIKSIVGAYIKLSSLKSKNYSMSINESYLVSNLEQKLSQEFMRMRSTAGIKSDFTITLTFYRCYDELKKTFFDALELALIFYNELNKLIIDLDKIIKYVDEIIIYRQMLAKMTLELLSIHSESNELLNIIQNVIITNLYEIFAVEKINKLINYSINNIHINAKRQKQIEGLNDIEIQDLFENNCGVIFISIDEDRLGYIEDISPNLIKFLGYEKRDLENYSLNIIMPKLFGERHDTYLIRFLDKFKKYKRTINSRSMLICDKRGYAYPATVNIQMEILQDKLSIVGLLKVHYKEDVWNLYTNQCGEIIGYDHFLYDNIVNKMFIFNDPKILEGFHLALFIPRVFGMFMCTFNPELKSYFGSEPEVNEDQLDISRKIILSQVVHIIVPKTPDILQILKLRYKDYTFTYSKFIDSQGQILASIASSIYSCYEVNKVQIFKTHLNYTMNSYDNKKLYVGFCEFTRTIPITDPFEASRVLDNCKKFIINSCKLCKVLTRKQLTTNWDKANIPEVNSQVLDDENKNNNAKVDDNADADNISNSQKVSKINGPISTGSISLGYREKIDHLHLHNHEKRKDEMIQKDNNIEEFEKPRDNLVICENNHINLFQFESYPIIEMEGPKIADKMADLNRITRIGPSPFSLNERNQDNLHVNFKLISDSTNNNNIANDLMNKSMTIFTDRTKNNDTNTNLLKKAFKTSFGLSNAFSRHPLFKEDLTRSKHPIYSDDYSRTINNSIEDGIKKSLQDLNYSMLLSNFQQNRSYIYNEPIKGFECDTDNNNKFLQKRDTKAKTKEKLKDKTQVNNLINELGLVNIANDIMNAPRIDKYNEFNRSETSQLKLIKILLNDKSTPLLIQKLNIFGYLAISTIAIIITILFIVFGIIIDNYEYHANIADFSCSLTYTLSRFHKDLEKSYMVVNNLWYYGIENLTDMQNRSTYFLQEAYEIYYDAMVYKALNEDLEASLPYFKYQNYNIKIMQNQINGLFNITQLSFLQSLPYLLFHIYELSNLNLSVMIFHTQDVEFIRWNFPEYYKVLNMVAMNLFNDLVDNIQQISAENISIIMLIISVSISFLFLGSILPIYQKLESKRNRGLSLLATLESSDLETKIKILQIIKTSLYQKYELATNNKTTLQTSRTKAEEEANLLHPKITKLGNNLGQKSKKRNLREWKKKGASSVYVLLILLLALAIITSYFVAYSEVIKSKHNNFLQLAHEYYIISHAWAIIPTSYVISYRIINLCNVNDANTIQNIYKTYNFIILNLNTIEAELVRLRDDLPVYISNPDSSDLYKTAKLALYTQNICDFIPFNEFDMIRCKSLLQGDMRLGLSGIYQKIQMKLKEYYKIILESTTPNITIATSIIQTSNFEELDIILDYMGIILREYNGLLKKELLRNLNMQMIYSIIFWVCGNLMTIIMLMFIWIPFIKQINNKFWKVKETYGLLPLDMLITNSYLKKYLKDNSNKII